MAAEPIPPRCEGCGGPAHGSVTSHVICLRGHLLAARAKLKEWEKFEKLRAEILAMPLTPNEKLQNIKRVPIK